MLPVPCVGFDWASFDASVFGLSDREIDVLERWLAADSEAA